MKKDDIRKLVESVSTELAQEINVAKSNLKDARTLTTQLQNLVARSETIAGDIEKSQTNVNATLTAATSEAATIHDASVSTADLLTDIQTKLATVQQNITTMDTAYTQFLATKTKIDDTDTGLDALLTSSRQYEAQIQALHTSSTTLNTQIQSELTSVQQYVATMKTAYEDFLATKAKIDDTDTGLDALLTSSTSTVASIEAAQKECETLYKTISRFKDQAATNIASIETIKANSEAALEAVTKNADESTQIKDRISGIFELVSQSGHANYFDRRRHKLILACWGWLASAVVCVIAAIILGAVYIGPLVKVHDGNITSTLTLEALLIRVSFVTPALALAVFCVASYGKDRRLAEQYAFKAVSASTVEGSLLLLDRSLAKVEASEKDDHLVEFAIETLRCIHTEPQELTKTSRLKFNAGNKVMELGGELSENIEQLSKNIQNIASDKTKS